MSDETGIRFADVEFVAVVPDDNIGTVEELPQLLHDVVIVLDVLLVRLLEIGDGDALSDAVDFPPIRDTENVPRANVLDHILFIVAPNVSQVGCRFEIEEQNIRHLIHFRFRYAPGYMLGCPIMIVDDLQPLAKPIGELRQWEGNYREGDVGAVAVSLARFGQTKPVVARHFDGDDGVARLVIIAGNHTYKAARHLNWPELAVVTRDDLSEAEAIAYAIADNRSSDLATNNDGILGELLSGIADDEALLLATGFDGDDLDALLAEGDGQLPDIDFDDGFGDPAGTDMVSFRFGDVSGLISRDTYASFVAAYDIRRKETGGLADAALLLDDVISSWLK